MENLKGKIIEQLKEVMDKELPISIYDLGLIYKIDIDENNNVSIDMTLIDSRCSNVNSLIDEINLKIKTLDEINKCEVHMVYTPKWELSKITPEGLEKLRASAKEII